MLTLEEILASEREDAAVLRARGLADRAADIERVCDRVQESLGNYLRWLSETEAILWSGRSAKYLRDRFAGWVAQGDARKVGRNRQYRASAIPRNVDVAGLRQRARQEAAA
jgi:hypothetical protein